MRQAMVIVLGCCSVIAGGAVGSSTYATKLGPAQYLNNILEQNHRAIKRRVNAKQGFREFQAAPANHSRLRSSPHDPEGTDSMGAGNDLLRQTKFIDHLFDLAA
jgi:hypothetical protein